MVIVFRVLFGEGGGGGGAVGVNGLVERFRV